MIEIFIILFVFFYACNKHYYVIVDAIEFTCIDYDEFLIDDEIIKKEIKIINYEDKYKTELLKLPNEYVIDEKQKNDRYEVLLKQSISEITDKINKELVSYEGELKQETDYDIVDQRINFISDKMEKMKMELWAKILIHSDIQELAETQLIQERLDKLIISFVMEHTPLGNVIMYYNNKREIFDYYSDFVIPYRYLDTVCRKYVIMNLCRPLYVDMNEELCKIPINVEVKKEVLMPKKNVFAKLKNYKKSTPIVTQNVTKTRTNKYSYQGRMNNFSFMKQAESKPVFSYADYKKSILSK